MFVLLVNGQQIVGELKNKNNHFHGGGILSRRSCGGWWSGLSMMKSVLIFEVAMKKVCVSPMKINLCSVLSDRVAIQNDIIMDQEHI